MEKIAFCSLHHNRSWCTNVSLSYAQRALAYHDMPVCLWHIQNKTLSDNEIEVRSLLENSKMPLHTMYNFKVFEETLYLILLAMFKDYDYVFIAEDDIVLSQDCFLYAEQSLDYFIMNKVKFATLGLYGNSNDTNCNGEFSISSYNGWGVILSKELFLKYKKSFLEFIHIKQMKKNDKQLVDIISKRFQIEPSPYILGFDGFVRYLTLRDNWPNYFSLFSRIANIGIRGVHNVSLGDADAEKWIQSMLNNNIQDIHHKSFDLGIQPPCQIRIK